MSFQKTVNAVPAPGIAGDFASTNPRHSALAPPGGFTAGAAGVACGYFAWFDQATASVLNNFGITLGYLYLLMGIIIAPAVEASALGSGTLGPMGDGSIAWSTWLNK
jgi:hypothetical protein